MSTPVNQDTDSAARQIKTLAASARALMERGDLASAEGIYRRILDVAPYHGPTLSFFAKRANETGDYASALVYIEKAIKGNPGKVVHILNRARTYANLGRLAEALQDLDTVLTLAPNHPGTLFHKALLQRDLGDRKAAVRTAILAWKSYPQPESLVSDPDAPKYLQEQVTECANLIRSTQLVLMDSELEPVIRQHGKEALGRVFDAVRSYSGLASTGGDSTMQGLTLPDIAPLPSPSAIDAPWKPALAAALPQIRSAADTLLPLAMETRGKIGRAVGPTSIWDLLSAPGLAQPLVTLAENEAVLTLLPPNTSLRIGRHPQNWKVGVYLPLDISSAATLAYGKGVMEIKPGMIVATDSRTDHKLHNPGPGPLRLLRFDIWHPGVTPAEQEGITAVLRGIRKFDAQYIQAASQAGGMQP